MPRKRYRITVTPIESDGRPCNDRCTIEFEQRARVDWMRLLEELHLRRDLSSDECAALTVGSQLLEDLAARPRAQSSDALDALRPKLQLLLAGTSAARAADAWRLRATPPHVAATLRTQAGAALTRGSPALTNVMLPVAGVTR